MTNESVARARALVGTRFRLQGRGPDGLDCVGVVLATYAIQANSIRANYALREDNFSEVREGLGQHFRRIARKDLRPGDVMLLQVNERQPHLGVRTDRGFVHAHLGIRRVVETPGMPEWPLLGVYRKRSR